MSADPTVDAIVRDECAARVLAELGPCELCGATVEVTKTKQGVRCYSHHLGSGQRREVHHPAGFANIPGWTVRLSANSHRELSEVWIDLGFDRFPSASGDPLLLAAYSAAGLASIAVLLARWLFDYAA